MEKLDNFIEKFFHDRSDRYSEEDIKKNKVFAMLPFFSFVTIPFLIKQVIKLFGMMYFLKFSLALFWKPILLLIVFATLVLAAFIGARKSKFAAFYFNQGISFGIWGFLLSVAVEVIIGIVHNSAVSIVLFVVLIAYYVFGVAFSVYNILKGKVRRNPIVGKKTYFKNL